MATLSDILFSANSFLDLESALPTGTELTTRVNFADQSVKDAASAYRFKEFETIYYPSTSTSASLSLPSNFRELSSIPVEYDSSGNQTLFPELRLEQVADGLEQSKDFCYLLGNSMEGHTLVFNGLTANATLSLQYQLFPSGMATLTDVCELPDPEYVKQ